MVILDEAALADYLERTGLAGTVQTSVQSCVENCHRLVAGDPDCTFGVSDWQKVTVPDVIAALRACGVHGLDGKPSRGATAYIDPKVAVEGIARQRDTLAKVAGARTPARVLVATGHAFALLPHYQAIVRALRSSGCEILLPLDGQRESLRTPSGQPCSIRYLDGVGTLAFGGALHHTHRSHYMEAMLDAAGGAAAVDLVIGDHGFAGAAVEAGIATLAIADANDPVLPLAQARGRTDGVMVIDDGLDPAKYDPVTAAVLAWD